MKRKAIITVLIVGLVASLAMNWLHWQERNDRRRILAHDVLNSLGGARGSVGFAGVKIAEPGLAAIYLKEAEIYLLYSWHLSARYQHHFLKGSGSINILTFFNYYQRELSDIANTLLRGTSEDLNSLSDAIASLEAELAVLLDVFDLEAVLTWKSAEQLSAAIDEVGADLPTFSKYVRNTFQLK